MIDVLTTDADKYAYVMNHLQSYDHPLMIIGSGGNGKTSIIHRTSDVASEYMNVLIMNITEMPTARHFRASTHPSDRLGILIEALGDESDYEFADKMNAKIVRFNQDPRYIIN